MNHAWQEALVVGTTEKGSAILSVPTSSDTQIILCRQQQGTDKSNDLPGFSDILSELQQKNLVLVSPIT